MDLQFYKAPPFLCELFRLEKLLQNVGISNVVFTENSPKAANGNWPAGISHIYQDDVSIRSIEVSYENNIFQSRIFTGSSPDDYRLGIKLAKAAAELSGSTIDPEDGEPVSLEQLESKYGEHWIDEHSNTSTRTLLAMFQQEANCSLTLAGTRAELTMGTRFMAPLIDDSESFPSVIWERFRRLNYIDREDIYEAAAVVLQDQTNGNELRVTNYSQGIPTLLPGNVDVVSMNFDRPWPENNQNKAKDIHVPFVELASTLGDRAIWLSENCLLAPSIEGKEWEALLNSLEGAHVEEIFSLSKAPSSNSPVQSNDNVGPFNKEEWNQLCMAPSLVFLSVAAADGKVDKKELAAFSKILRQTADSGEGVFHHMLLGAIEHVADHIASLKSGDFDPTENLAAVGRIMDGKLSPEEAKILKMELFRLGVTIAESSGGLLGFIGSKIDQNEKIALALIAVSLGIN